jgi:hypothetical protein
LSIIAVLPDTACQGGHRLFDHVGYKHGCKRHIDGYDGLFHEKSLKGLSAPQQLAVDIAQLLERFLHPVIRANTSPHLFDILLENIDRIQFPLSKAQGQVVLGSMSLAGHALASGFATAFVSLDNRPAYGRRIDPHYALDKNLSSASQQYRRCL